MNTWSPIFTQQSIIPNVIKGIAQEICDNIANIKNPDLYSGLAGNLLFLSYYEKAFKVNSKGNWEYGDIVYNLVHLTNEKTRKGSFFHGLAGIAWVISHTSHLRGEEKKYKDLTKSFDGYVSHFLFEGIKGAEYDFCHGYLGMAYYLLTSSTLKQKNKKIILERVIKRLEETAIWINGGAGWENENDKKEIIKSNKEGLDTVTSFCNLGMAHGIPSVISFLIDALPIIEEKERVFSLIEKAVAFLLEYMQLNEFGFFFKSNTGIKEKEWVPKLGWCYGDLPISLLFIKLYEKTNQGEYLEIALKIAKNAVLVPIKKIPLSGASICHGATAFAHLYHRLFHKTAIQAFKTASTDWYKILFDQFYKLNPQGYEFASLKYDKKRDDVEYINDTGLYMGTSGIGLSLIGCVTLVEPKWDKVLFLI